MPRDVGWIMVYSAVSAIWLSLLVNWLRRERRAGALLLALPQPLRLGGIVVGVLLLVASTYAFSTLASHVRGTPRQMLSYLSQLLLSVWLMLVAGRAELRERGLVHMGSLVLWQNVASWSWNGNQLRLQRKSERPVRDVLVQAGPAVQPDVEKLLQKRIREHNKT